MGRTLYLLINIINKHLLNIGYVHDNSNTEDFSTTGGSNTVPDSAVFSIIWELVRKCKF